MRVLMVNRSDARRASGGDIVQLQKTREALRDLGVTVDVRLADHLEGDWDYDLAHIFNLQSASESWQACLVAKDKRLPVVLSPIYWNFSALWYWTNPNLRSFWRVIKRLLGRWGYRPYALWQWFRSPASELWQIQRKLLTAVDMLLPNSRLEALQIFHDFRLSQSTLKYEVVPNAIDGGMFDPIPAPSARLRALTGGESFVLEVGRISPEKNTLGLIEALWDVAASLLFVGQPSPYDPDYVDACYARGKERGRVHFLDWLAHEELPGVYAAAAVHALPSWRETPGLVSLEAAASGCPVVSTSIGSAYEYFGDEVWYCHPADKNGIKRAVLSALGSSSSEKLRMHVLEHFTWQVAAQATLAAYQRMLT